MRAEPGSPRQRKREEAGACSGGLRWGSGGAQLGWALRWHQDGAIAGSPGEGAGESGRESGKWSFSGQDREGRAGTGADAPTSVGSPFLGWVGGGGGGGVQPGECSILYQPGQSEGYEA